MTTHELADLLDSLKKGLGGSLKQDAGTAFDEAVAAFRELPDQHLKKLAELLRKANGTTNGKRAGATPVAIPALVERIRAVRTGTATDALPELDVLNNAQLREILVAYGQQPTTTTTGNLAKVKQLLNSSDRSTEPISTAPRPEAHLVDEGVRLYTRLRDTKGVTIPEVRAGFAALREYPKSVVEEISRRVGYTPSGSRKDVLDRLQSNLEDIKLHQLSTEFVGSGA